jgi:hypothetical protein
VLRFARYALAPNRLGYCGPSDDTGLFEHAVDLSVGRTRAAVSGAADPLGTARELRVLAQGFEGAWPYLELIAGANGIADPLDDQVVAAYWLGGPLLRAVGPLAAGNHVEARFRSRAGRWWAEVAAALEPGVVVNHAFHVMVVGPWVGMLRAGRSDAPLEVIDRCRIRRGKVLELHGDEAVVVTDRMSFTSGVLAATGRGSPTTEWVRLGEGGRHPCGPVRVGDVVAIHWDWVCEVLTPAAALALRQGEQAATERANRALSVPGAPELG